MEAGEADLRDLFEENDEPADADEERGREANEKQLKKLFTATTRLGDRIRQARVRIGCMNSIPVTWQNGSPRVQ